MNMKAALKKKIYELDFAIYELALFLDTNPTSSKALRLLEEFREKRKEAIENYEEKFGKYIATISDVPATGSWQWLDSPWPWDADFMED